MKTQTKQVQYIHGNTYETLNKIGPSTKNVWLVFHGIGFLSSYFLRYFDELNAEENYIIAPQAPSKYYLDKNYKYVGASWLTKVDREQEIHNVLRYIDTVVVNENIPGQCDLYILGFSQGVSIATRWIAQRKISCKKLILYAGGLPNELIPEDFSHFLASQTEVLSVVGTMDEYISDERLKEETQKLDHLFSGRTKLISFIGGHELKRELINSFAE